MSLTNLMSSKRFSLLRCCLLGAATAFVPTLVSAAPRAQKGDPPQLVLQVYGPPLEKIEMESKRQAIWRYKGGDVLFSEGIVSSSTLHSKDRLPVQEKPLIHTAKEGSAKIATEIPFELDNEETQLQFAGTDIFDEISKLKDGAPDSDAKESPRSPKRPPMSTRKKK